MLDRQGDEVARATSIVRYAPGSRFEQHSHGGGEEILVLEGTFSDEHGDYAAGTYLRNPSGSSHAPFSERGCTILVKLRQMHPADQQRTVIDTTSGTWVPGLVRGLEVLPLHAFGSEHVALVRWAPGTVFQPHGHPGGEEILVLDGVFHNKARSGGPGHLPAQPWCRPRGVRAQLREIWLLGECLIVADQRIVQLWAELPALAPGARCLGGRSTSPGHLGRCNGRPLLFKQCVKQCMKPMREARRQTNSWVRNITDPLRVLEQGPDRQRAPCWCSGGLSSIRGASESRCIHHGSATSSGQLPHADRHRSLPAATALHEAPFMAHGRGGRLRGRWQCPWIRGTAPWATGHCRIPELPGSCGPDATAHCCARLSPPRAGGTPGRTHPGQPVRHRPAIAGKRVQGSGGRPSRA
jgi:anti-sigma factor ChrR (cupin superfamily)